MVFTAAVLLVALLVVRLQARLLWTDATGVLTGLSVVTMTWTGVTPGGLPVSDVLLGVTLAVALPGLLAGRTRMRIPAPCLVAAVVVAAVVVLNALVVAPQSYAQGRYQSFGPIPLSEPARQVLNLLNGAKLVIALLVIPVLLCVVARDRHRWRTLTDLWAASAAVSAAVALTDYVGVTSIALHLGIPYGIPGGRGSGLTNHPVHLATICVMVLPIVLTWLLRPGARRWAGIGVLLVLAGGTFVTGSRSGLVAFVLVLFVGALVHEPLRRFAVLVALPTTLLLVLVVLLEPSLLHTFLEKTRLIGANAQGSDTARRQIAAQALRDIAQRPLLGLGFDVASDGHSVYLQALAAGGVATLGAMVAWVTGALRTARLRTHGAVDLMTGACLLSVASWFVLITVENAFLERYMYLPFAFLIALAAIRSDEERSAPRRASTAASSADLVPLAVPSQV